MPFRSEKQRRFMHANHPDIANRWEHEYGSKPVGKKNKKDFTKAAQRRLRKRANRSRS